MEVYRSEMTSTALLEEWWEGEKGRAVDIEVGTTYGATAWEVILINANKHPGEDWYKYESSFGVEFACVYAAETYFIDGEIPPNMVYVKGGNEPGGFPGLDPVIRLAVKRARELGI